MNQQRRARIQARDQARENVGRATRWGLSAGLAIAAASGLAFGLGHPTATAGADVTQPNPPPQNTVQPGDGGQVALQPPQQAPTPGIPEGGYSSSGGS